MSQTMNIIDADFQIKASLALPEDEVQLWRVDLEAVRSERIPLAEIPFLRRIGARLPLSFSDRRQRFVASRALLRTILAGYLATDPNCLSFSYSKKEKPSVGPAHAGSGVTFNVSHSGGIALFAFTRRREIVSMWNKSPRFRPGGHRPPLLFCTRAQTTCRFAKPEEI